MRCQERGLQRRPSGCGTPPAPGTEILDVATSEFAAHGYQGSRVDEIAALTRTTKRMIYYHFGGKKQLYIAVLERAYARIRSAERKVRRRRPRSRRRRCAASPR